MGATLSTHAGSGENSDRGATGALGTAPVGADRDPPSLAEPLPLPAASDANDSASAEIANRRAADVERLEAWDDSVRAMMDRLSATG
jgi:hypothetical protein